MFRSLLTALFLLFWSLPAMAADTASAEHFTAKLVAESAAPAPGQSVTLALVIRPEKGWHIYWVNPGDTGLPPELDWNLPKGVTAGETKHPVPSELVLSGLASNVHVGTVALLTPLTLPDDIPKGAALPVGLEAHFLLCSDSTCLPRDISLNVDLTVGGGAPDPAQFALFAKARAALPSALPASGHYITEKGQLRLVLPIAAPDDLQSAHLFVRDEDVIPPGAAQTVNNENGSLTITVAAGQGVHADGFSGVLRLETAEHGVKGYSFVAEPGGTAASPALGSSFFLAFGGAILGGLLLNLMPCVFPILSLKALALARAGGDEREARMEAIGYTLGAVGVLVTLGALVLALRSGGHAVGWAFQLQDTRVLAVLLLLVTAIATNLAGLFEVPSMNLQVGQGTGLLGGVGTGALAAFIATPCTGPFMAGALGTALLLPVPAALAVFTGLGLGLALPFLCLGFFAPARRWLPKPGAWMATLRRVLSLPMFATALGLAWVIGRQGGVSAMTMALGAALLLAVGLWWYGLRQVSGQRALPALLPAAAAVALALTGVTAVASVGSGEASHLLASQPYTAARLAALRADHQPVFVFLTADWCLSCKVNEATSLSAASVAEAFSKAHVAVLEGDWTDGNPEVSRLLAERHRAGVPLYLWYPADGDPKELPQILTPSMLVSLPSKNEGA